MRDKNIKNLYIESLYIQENDVLQKAKDTLHDDRKNMQMSGAECKILHMLIVMNNIKKVLEIGTLVGYSALWMAQGLPDDGSILTIENNPEHAKLARRNIADNNKVTLIEGSAVDVLGKIDDKFDMIFIDADKASYPAYLDYAESHIRKGGLIVADNVFLFDTVFMDYPVQSVSKKSWDAMRDFNKRLSNKDLYTSIILPTDSGLAIAIKNYD